MRQIILSLIVFVMFGSVAIAETITVRPDGTGDYPTIQAAVDAASDMDVIELTDGTFSGEGNRDIDFGGKAIVVQSQSEDPTTCIIDCEANAKDMHRGFHFQTQETVTSAVSGVTVMNGHSLGGGAILFSAGSSPLIDNCIFDSNYAGIGGAFRTSNESNPTIASCIFTNNESENSGGAIYIDRNNPTIAGCTFTGNVAGGHGGGIYMDGSMAGVDDCVFDSNEAGGIGGGMDCYSSNPMMTMCTFIGNVAAQVGGGMVLYNSGGTITTTLFQDNEAGQGGAMYIEQSTTTLGYCTFSSNAAGTTGALYADESTFTLQNSTFTQNTASQGAGAIDAANGSHVTIGFTIIAYSAGGAAVLCDGTSSVDLSCCDVFGNEGGDYVDCIGDQNGVNNNISADPEFCSTQPDEDQTWEIQSDSPCLAAPCMLMGSGEVGCGTTVTLETSWGRIKGTYKE